MALFQEISDQFRNLNPSRKDLRHLGLIFLAALAVIAGILWWRERPAAPWFLAGAALFGLWGLAWPQGLGPLYRVWMGLALVLNYFVSRLILTLMFFLVLTPIGLLLRVLGRDLLDLKMKDRESYWFDRSAVSGRGGSAAGYAEIHQGSGKIALMIQFWRFLRERKKFWLLPIILMLLLLGALIIFGEGSALAPFIYTLF